MTRTALRIALTLALLTLVLLVLVLTVPGQRDIFVGVYELLVGALVIAALIGEFRLLSPAHGSRSPFDRVAEEPERPTATADLERIDRLVVLASGSGFDVHYRLRPLLRELADARLHAGQGVELDRDHERARRLLGDEAWDVVRPDAELPARSGPGLSTVALERIVARLEAL